MSEKSDQVKKTENKKSLNKLSLIDLKRRLTPKEYAVVMTAAEEAFKQIERSLPADLQGTIAVKAIGVDKRAMHSLPVRLVNYSTSLSMAMDPNLSMRIIEANREMATEIGGDRENLHEAVETIGNIINRKYKYRNAIYSRKPNNKKASKE